MRSSLARSGPSRCANSLGRCKALWGPETPSPGPPSMPGSRSRALRVKTHPRWWTPLPSAWPKWKYCCWCWPLRPQSSRHPLSSSRSPYLFPCPDPPSVLWYASRPDWDHFDSLKGVKVIGMQGRAHILTALSESIISKQADDSRQVVNQC